MPIERKPNPPGIGMQILTLGKAGALYEAWAEFHRNQMRAADRQREGDEREAAWAVIEPSLDLIRQLTYPSPHSPRNLNFAVVQRSKSPDPNHRFWDLLGVTTQEHDYLLTLAPNLLSPTGEFDPEARPKLHLVSKSQHLMVETGIESPGWQDHYTVDLEPLITDGYDTWQKTKKAWEKDGFTYKSLTTRNARVAELLTFVINNLTTIHIQPQNQMNLFSELRPELNYDLLAQEAWKERQSPFELTPQEFLGWLPLEDAENIRKLTGVLNNFAQEHQFSFGVVAVGSMADPIRRWSSAKTKDFDLLFYVATGGNEYKEEELSEYLSQHLEWKCEYSADQKSDSWDDSWGDESHPPYFKLTPATGKKIELHPEWQTWDTPQAVRTLISLIRANRAMIRNPYFAVLIEP